MARANLWLAVRNHAGLKVLGSTLDKRRGGDALGGTSVRAWQVERPQGLGVGLTPQ
jgi:hypothetical protein